MGGLHSEYGVWHGLVEYSHTVMEAVRQQAVNGFNSFGHGGLEIGGVLYGERHGDVIRVFGCAELICEHASGPGFVLSPKDEAAFRELIKPPHGLRAVGWYCSHTRSGLALNPNDCAIMERFFGERSLALIVKPLRFGPMEATFYIHGIAEPGPHFSVLVAREPELETNALQPAPVLTPVLAPRSPRETLPAPAAAIPMVRHRRPKRRWVWAAFACLLLVIGYIAMRPSATTAHGKEKLGLQAYGIAERQVRIEWDRQAPAIRSAKSGTLEIADGSSKYAVPLSSEQLQSSTLTYARQSDAISIALRLSGGVTESVHFVAPSVKEPAPASAPPGPAAVPPPGPQAAAGESKLIAEVSPNAERRASPLRQFTVAEVEPAAKPRSVPLPDPPAIAALAKIPASLPIALPSQPPLHVPRSGRMIWTGSLGRRGVVEFEGSASTLGSLSGALPGLASKLAVYPAEFGRDGLTVYVTDASRHNKTEPPGALTGWNRLHFVWDPERVKQLTVLEAPSSNNQFSRLALRNDARQCSVIVVEWSVP